MDTMRTVYYTNDLDTVADTSSYSYTAVLYYHLVVGSLQGQTTGSSIINKQQLAEFSSTSQG